MSEKQRLYEDERLISLAQQGDRNALEMIISAYLPLIRTVTARFYISNNSFTREELLHAGVLGLIQSINHFSPKIGVNLRAYAMPWILGEMRLTIRKSVDSSGLEFIRRKMEREQECLLAKLGRTPTLDELAKACSLSREAAAELISLNHLVTDGCAQERMGRVQSDETEASDIRFAIDSMNQEEQKLIMLRFFRDKTQQETACLLNKSQAQISKMERRALDHLRALLE